MKAFRILLFMFAIFGSIFISYMYFTGEETLLSYAMKLLGLVGIMLIVSFPYIRRKLKKHKR